MHIHRAVVQHVNSVYIIEGRYSFLNKLNIAFHANSFAPLLCVCTWCLNRVNRRLKKIGEEETGYHKPFSVNFKDAVDCKTKFLDPSANRIDHSTRLFILCLTEL